MTKILKKDSGVMVAFFGLVVVPLMFILFTLLFEFSGFYMVRETYQSVASAAALQGVQGLPNGAVASGLARSYAISKLAEGDYNLSPTINVATQGDSLRVDLNAQYAFRLPRLFNINAVVPVRATAVARNTPGNYFVVFDTSSYMAEPFGTLFPSSPGAVPSSLVGFPGSSANFVISDAMSNIIAVADPAMWLTHRCFSSGMIQIKDITRRVVRFLGANPNNAVGVGSFPNQDGLSLFQMRSVAPLGYYASNGDLIGEADFQGYENSRILAPDGTDIGTFASDFYCLAMAEAASPEYELPPINWSVVPVLPASCTGIKLIQDISVGAMSAVDPALNCLSVDMAIWSKSIRGETSIQNRVADVSGILEESRIPILLAGSIATRGGLVNSYKKALIIIAGNVPFQGGIRFGDAGDGIVRAALLDQLTQLSSDGIEVHYIVARHEGVADDITGASYGNLEFRIDALTDYLESQQLDDVMRVHYSVNPLSLLSMILKTGETAVVSQRG